MNALPTIIIAVTLLCIVASETILYAGSADPMSDKTKSDSKPTLRDVSPPLPTEPKTVRPQLPPQRPSRTVKQLEPVAIKITENSVLMERFRAAYGSGNVKLMSAVTTEITKRAQEIDPTITHVEGTTISTMIPKLLGIGYKR
jgi:hypothetical protein